MFIYIPRFNGDYFQELVNVYSDPYRDIFPSTEYKPPQKVLTNVYMCRAYIRGFAVGQLVTTRITVVMKTNRDALEFFVQAIPKARAQSGALNSCELQCNLMTIILIL